MNYLIALLLTVCSLTVNAQVADSNYAVLPYKTVWSNLFPKGSKSAGLTKADIAQIEKLLEVCINDDNVHQLTRYNELRKEHPNININDFVIDLKKYKQQIICAVSPNGDKIVWVNCFCFGGDTITWIYGDHPRNYWKTNVIRGEDGGNCYFNVKINLTRKKCYDLMVNGEA